MSDLPKLPKIAGRRLSPEEISKLTEWLDEWEIFQALGGYEAEATEESEAPDPAPATHIEGDPRHTAAPGDILILEPALVGPDFPRIPWFAVLARWDEDSLLMAPFSTLGVPASPGEWRTGREFLPLRVLCLWNARTVPVDLAERSWLADQLSESERVAALEVYKSHTLGRDLRPPAAAADIGPPIIHPSDPRRTYLRAEIRLHHFFHLRCLEAWKALTAKEKVLPFPAFTPLPLPLAAADQDRNPVGIVPSGAPTDPSLPANVQARVVNPLWQQQEDATLAFAQWALSPPLPQFNRGFLVDPDKKQVLGKLSLSGNGKFATLTEAPWTALEPYAANPSAFARLTLVLRGEGA